MKILIGVAAALLLLLLMPIAAKISYSGALEIRVGVFRPFFKIFPARPKRKKEKKKGPKKNKSQNTKDNQKEKVKMKLDRALIFGLLKKFPGYFKRLLVIGRIEFDGVIGNEDPADLALTYGGVSAALESAAAALSPLYPIEKWKVRLKADFERQESEIHALLTAHTNLLRIFAVLISFGIYVMINNSNDKGDQK